MISEERLKELIRRKSPIYLKDGFTKIYPHKWKSYNFITGISLVKGNLDKIYGLRDLFETKEEADWERKFKRIERAEYLDLPSWEEVSNKKASCTCFLTNDGLNSNTYFLQVANYSEDCNYIYIRDFYSRELFYSDKATKENYIKACEMAKRLFLGKGE